MRRVLLQTVERVVRADYFYLFFGCSFVKYIKLYDGPGTLDQQKPLFVRARARQARSVGPAGVLRLDEPRARIFIGGHSRHDLRLGGCHDFQSLCW